MDKMNAITRSLTESAALFLMLVTGRAGGRRPPTESKPALHRLSHSVDLGKDDACPSRSREGKRLDSARRDPRAPLAARRALRRLRIAAIPSGHGGACGL